MNLTVDIGNSSVKTGLFNGNQLVKARRYSNLTYQRILGMMTRYKVNNMILSSVKKDTPEGISRLKKYANHFVEMSTQTPLPIKNLYRSPETLGNDRLAAVIGASAIFPNANVLVIDIGTALTVDFLNKKGEYEGGNISPGLNMRFQALHHFTSSLPLASSHNTSELLGNNTEKAIVAGVQNGIIFEINEYIKLLSDNKGTLKAILTGGDSNFFDNKLNYPIFAEPNLVLIGLNKILKFNIYAR